jgi:hypothetical protein
MIDYTQKSPARNTRKICAKCGKPGWYRPRERFCKYRAFGARSYCCWGALSRPEKRQKKAPTIAEQLRAAMASAQELIDPEIAEAAEAMRRGARLKLAKAQAKVTDLARDLKRFSKLLDKYQTRANYYAKRAAMTNSEFQAERAKRKAETKEDERAEA